MMPSMDCRCGAPATANGRECPRHFRERLASIRVENPSQTKVDYFDSKALDETFGEDRVQRYWDDTKGMGALEKVGDHYEHEDWRGDRYSVDGSVAEAFVKGVDLAVQE